MAALTATVASTDVSCFGAKDGTITISNATGGYGTYQYSINGGTTWQDAASFNALADGTYNVQIRDKAKNTCTAIIDSKLIIKSPTAALTATVASTDVSCFGAKDGTITISNATGGYGTYQYSINGGTTWQDAASFNALADGTYNVQIRDKAKNTCTAIIDSKVIIKSPTAALTATVASTDVSCFGAKDGTITISNATGGYGTYQYSINGGTTWQDAASFNALADGTYNVQIRDKAKNTCTAIIDSKVIIKSPTATLTAAVVSTDVSCFGSNDGNITINNPSGGYGTYQYSINGGTTWQDAASFMSLSSGSYNVQIRDKAKNSCTATIGGTIIISAPSTPLTATAILSNNVNCIVCNTGSINLNVSGGTAPYTFSWSNSKTTEDIQNLTSGTYTVKITDKHNCEVIYSYTITNSGIALVKTGVFVDTNNDGFAQVGEKVNYAFSVTNTGNVTVTNIVVTDPKVSVNGIKIPTLAPGQTIADIFTATYTLTQADIDAGQVTIRFGVGFTRLHFNRSIDLSGYNTALAVGTDPKGNEVRDTSGTTIDNDTPTVVDISNNVKGQIALVKSGVFVDTNNDGFAQVGEKVNYAFSVTNTGNVTVTNIVVTDPKVSVNGIKIPTLAPGQTIADVFTATYTLTQADIDAGQVTNTALAVGTDPKGNEVRDTSGTTIDNDTPTVVDISNNVKGQIALVKSGVFVDTNNDGFAQVGEKEIFERNVTVTQHCCDRS